MYGRVHFSFLNGAVVQSFKLTSNYPDQEPVISLRDIQKKYLFAFMVSEVGLTFLRIFLLCKFSTVLHHFLAKSFTISASITYFWQ